MVTAQYEMISAQAHEDRFVSDMTPSNSRLRIARLAGATAAILGLAWAGAACAQVEVQSLTKLDLFSAGRDTGFGMGVWKGTSADIARQVIPTLASRPLSPAGTALARRLLAQSATAPDGAGADADLAAARVRALLALGETSLAGSILDHTPNLSENGPCPRPPPRPPWTLARTTRPAP